MAVEGFDATKANQKKHPDRYWYRKSSLIFPNIEKPQCSAFEDFNTSGIGPQNLHCVSRLSRHYFSLFELHVIAHIARLEDSICFVWKSKTGTSDNQEFVNE